MRRLLALSAAALTVVTVGVAPIPAGATTPTVSAPAGPVAPPPSPDPSTVDPAARDRVLPGGWRSSADIAWTTGGDATGFHVLAADARSGYTWRTAATLAEPGFDTDRWIGNACLTGSGRRPVVVYAPRPAPGSAISPRASPSDTTVRRGR
ncbi:hypothetical protein [Nonomuraea sp. MG754425]|uniref:hypothetical protein n=1 Tax=Nonomuraea sp. MG754425 TaxID=2570319 RepID=UPI001F41109F|nr:hypothetical protein [Nonomuraea sp. MG754425]